MFVTHDYELKMWRYDFGKPDLELVARLETDGKTLSEIAVVKHLQMFAYIEKGVKKAENRVRIVTNEGKIIKEIRSNRYTAVQALLDRRI
jgi:hypothetical protein